MPDPRSATSPPAPGAETGDDEVRALKDAVAQIGKRLDAMGKRDDDRRDDRRDDDRKRHDDGPITSHSTEELRAELRRREEEGEEGESDDDRRRDDDRRPDDDKDMPRRLAADDDRRRDTRADAARRTDYVLDRLSELQSEWDRVALAQGERASRPMDGEQPLTYDRRHARRFQHLSDKWKNADLSDVSRDILAIASPEIRADAIKAAYQPKPDAPPELREIIETDRTGRRISRFIGPVGVTLEPFRLRAQRVVRINRPPDRPYNDL